MIYEDRLTPPNNWPPLVRYPSYYPNRRLSTLWFLVLGIISLTLTVIALIIVFAVEHSWFRDNFNGSLTQYGLWRLCFTTNNICTSWFSTDGTYGNLVNQRLNQAKTGINAWQALEIIFLILTTATLIIALASLICYRFRNSLHYYLAILAAFCVWPAVCVGVAVLFVFGFAVFNVATQPRELDWCFYVNLAAVILALIAAILLSIYDLLLRKPIRNVDDDAVIETFPDLNGYPAPLTPSTFVIVRRNKQKRNKPYPYSQTLHPNRYIQKSASTAVTEAPTNASYISNPNPQVLTPYTSIVTTYETTNTAVQPPQQIEQKPSIPYRIYEYNRSNLVTLPSVTTVVPQTIIAVPTQSYERPLSPYQYQTQSSPPQLHRTRTNTTNQSMVYTSDASNDYIQRSYYNPNRSNVLERTFEQKSEPRVLHYYTGYDYFSTVDPSDATLTRHHPPAATRTGSAIRYGSNPSYYHQNDYVKSAM